LRSYIKHLEPPVRRGDTYESARARFDRSEEYAALQDDELRRSAFEKVIRRLKDKEEDTEKERAKRRDRASVEKSSYRDRERDRGERSHRNGRHMRQSRSPEPDAYEADRRKAIADRERNYRKTNVADTLLSPGRRGSERPEPRGDRADREREREPYRERDRERDLDRPHRGRRDDDRDRRERDDERDRLYRRRGDPRGSIDELPYGDEKPSGSRRRRADSDIESAGSRRDSKVRHIFYFAFDIQSVRFQDSFLPLESIRSVYCCSNWIHRIAVANGSALFHCFLPCKSLNIQLTIIQRTRRERTPPPARERSPAPVRDRPQKTRTPPPAATVKDDPAVHSGSEEGEIEEE
jgi:hypothetical protein